MLLHEQVHPLQTWEYAERYLGVGTRTYSPFASHLDISTVCHPQAGAPTFTLETYWVPPERGAHLRNQAVSPLNELYQHADGFLLPVHPDAAAHPELVGRDELLGCKPGPPIEVVPSANARTVFVHRIDGDVVPPHFLKLHYPRRLSRFTRRLRRPTIKLQLWTADELAREGVRFLPEVGAGIFGWDPSDSWGFLVRDVRPAGEWWMPFTVPLFALYGGDHRAADDPTLLEQLVEAAGEPPAEYVAGRIVRPMVRLWADVVRTTGCALELHGQNTLFRFSADGRWSEIVYRDCAIYVDPAIRKELGASGLPATNVISRDITFPREQVFSLTYDSFMGHHALDYIARLAEDRWGVAPGQLQEAAREALASGGASAFLPSTVFNYDGRLHPDGRWALVDTGRRPDWR